MNFKHSRQTTCFGKRLGFTLLLSGFIGVGLLLSFDLIGDESASFMPKANTAYADQGDGVARPEIDFQFPEATEIAIFALG